MIIATSAFVLAGLFFLTSKVILAEQQDATPESGTTSHLKSLESDLIDSDLGLTSNNPDWGSMWNRIATAAKWTPVGTATDKDVFNGRTFYSDERDTKHTGTHQNVSSCPDQIVHDDGAPGNPSSNCGLTWVTANPAVTGDDKQDPRTGLVWSKDLYSYNNNIEFHDVDGSHWSWNNSGSTNVAVGGKTAIELCSSIGNGWRLPTQKELMQANIDGYFYNLKNSSRALWSATSNSEATAVTMEMNIARITNNNRSEISWKYVKCVR